MCLVLLGLFWHHHVDMVKPQHAVCCMWRLVFKSQPHTWISRLLNHGNLSVCRGWGHWMVGWFLMLMCNDTCYILEELYMLYSLLQNLVFIILCTAVWCLLWFAVTGV